jgi:hypothetical protein
MANVSNTSGKRRLKNLSWAYLNTALNHVTSDCHVDPEFRYELWANHLKQGKSKISATNMNTSEESFGKIVQRTIKSTTVTSKTAQVKKITVELQQQSIQQGGDFRN